MGEEKYKPSTSYDFFITLAGDIDCQQWMHPAYKTAGQHTIKGVMLSYDRPSSLIP
jgi:hypothetical protein